MKIAGLQKVSLIDFPGRVAATVFLAGCNLNCGYCHNRWMISAANVTPALSTEAFLAWVETRVGLLDGICVSGGEPLLWPEIDELLAALHDLGMATKIDTNGTRPEVLGRLLAAGLVDYVAMDVKAPLDERYSETAGTTVDVAAIEGSLALLAAGAVPFEVRTTVPPGLDGQALRDLAAALAGCLPAEARWYLQPFVAAPGVDAALAQVVAMDEEALAAVAAELAATVPGVRVRGQEL